jgi:hypothetical protein
MQPTRQCVRAQPYIHAMLSSLACRGWVSLHVAFCQGASLLLHAGCMPEAAVGIRHGASLASSLALHQLMVRVWLETQSVTAYGIAYYFAYHKRIRPAGDSFVWFCADASVLTCCM